MKKSLLLFLPLLFAFFSGLQANVLTVSNRPGAAAQYKTVTEAITAARAGDTIYIHGSETSYGDITIDKKLTIIGTGHKPQKEQALVSNLSSVNIGGQSSAASGSSLIGLKISSIRTSEYGQKDIMIKRCDVSSIDARGRTGGICTDWIIENNLINQIIMYGEKTDASNFIIRNNIIHANLYYVSGSVVYNNIFVGNGGSFQEAYNLIIQNNIFYGKTPQGANNSTFNNNITFSMPDPELPYGTNSGHSNKINIDPQFISYPGGGFSYDHDYHLKDSSAGKNAGTDGTDIGIYGGMGFSETGEPPIPIVRAFSIQNGVIAPNGKLKIQFKAEAKN